MEKNFNGNGRTSKDGKKLLGGVLALFAFSVIMTLFVLLWYAGQNYGEVFTENILKDLAIFVMIVFLMFGLYVYMLLFEKKLLVTKNMVMIYLIMLLTLISCCVTSDLLNIFALPLQLCALMLCVLVGGRMAIAGNLFMSQMLLIIFLIKNPFAAESMSRIAASVFCNTISGFILIYLASLNLTRIKFILYSLIAGIAIAPFATVVSLAVGESGRGMLDNTLWVIGSNALAVILYMPLMPLFESGFNVITKFKLEEICDFSAPLLKQLSEKASGTFNHSIVVGNMAEKCAMAIGEDIRLARACAYYHDVGKIKSPEFFAENQNGGYNPHDDLIPEVSVNMISKHTKNGATLIREHHLPEELAQVALEHHGTTPIKAFYYKAQKITDGELDDFKFRYEGPKPGSKISAIVMLCDTTEAAVRAMNLKTLKEIDDFVTSTIKEKIDDGQFDECEITMSDLAKIKEAIVNMLAGIHHARVEYKK